MSKKLTLRKLGTRTATIEYEDYEPFDITYEVPTSGDLVDQGTALQEAINERASAGDTINAFVEAKVKSWTLKEGDAGDPLPIAKDTLDRLPVGILQDIYRTITETGAQAGN